MKHTPGPWSVEKSTLTSVLKIVAKPKEQNDNTVIARVVPPFTDNTESILNVRKETLANANLIGAAPELLEALIELKNMYLFNQTKAQAKNNHINETLLFVDRIIAKASE